MSFTMTMRTYKDTFLRFFSGFVNASRGNVKLLFRRVSVMKVKIAKVSAIPTNTTLSSVFRHQHFFDVLSFNPRSLGDFGSICFVISALIFRCTLFAAITSAIFGRTISVKINERFDNFTIGTFAG